LELYWNFFRDCIICRDLSVYSRWREIKAEINSFSRKAAPAAQVEQPEFNSGNRCKAANKSFKENIKRDELIGDSL
jgi:hypothetical protein